MPLAHLLAPQIAKKAQEIEDAIGPPRSAGYLNASETHPGVRRIYGVDPEKDPPPTTPGSYYEMIGKLQRSGDPALQAMARGFLKGDEPGRAAPQIMPNAPSPKYAGPEIKKTTKKDGTVVIQVDPRAMIGTNERGFPVDIKGRKQLGYLEAPMIAAGGGELAGRTLGRGKKDITTVPYNRSKPWMGLTLPPGDAFGADVLKREFGDDLKVMQENLDGRGVPTDKFPRGYLDHLSPKDQKKVKDGVKVLQNLERDLPMI